ncbi:MAG: DUF1501 domain-containing protein [Verrucomicrobiota bacterium]
MLSRCGLGMGALTASSFLGLGEASATGSPLAARKPHYRGHAKRVIHIFLNGGPSQVDTFDPKPTLTKWHGKEIPNNLRTERPTGAAMASPFEFQNYGQSGLPVSELFAKTAAAAADDLCVVRSMHANVPNHEPSLMLMNCGDSILPRPSMGSWISYGLGTENENLPAFVVLCPGLPVKGAENWRSAFLPGSFQATHIDTTGKTVDQLIANLRNKKIGLDRQREQMDFLRSLNDKHLSQRQGNDAAEARLQSFELAYRMQMEATDAFDVQREPKYIREMYGDTRHGNEYLIARRLVERGVRFVQLWHGKGQPWDSHVEVEKNHRRLANECDQPLAALLTDLKMRGLLEDTLVIIGGEFGRTPTVELPSGGTSVNAKNGRDHNHHGFTVALAGGGVKGGHIHGATDEFGFKAVQDRVHVHDLHATILHLLGFDHTKLTYRYAGRDFRLTDVEGRIVRDIVA